MDLTIEDEATDHARSDGRKERLVGCILCGGASRRMGRDKGSLELSGVTLVERASRLLARVCGEVVLATGSEARYAELGLTPLLDATEGGGPLEGILAALEHAARERAGEPLCCVLACDLPGARPAHFERLLDAVRERDLDACFYRAAGREHPLLAVYRTTCAPAMRAARLAGDRRVVAFREHPGPGGRDLRVGSLELAPGEAGFLRNVNTPEEFAAESRLQDGEAS